MGGFSSILFLTQWRFFLIQNSQRLCSVGLVKHTTEKTAFYSILGRFLVSVSSSALNKSGSWTKYGSRRFLSKWIFGSGLADKVNLV